MKQIKNLIVICSCISILIIGCKEKSSVAEKTVPDYTLIYKMEQNRDISITADKGYYEALARDKSCRWKEAIAYPNLKEETKFDSDDYLNWAMAAVDSTMTNDGYVTFFQDLNICKGEKFYGLGEHRMQGSGQKVTAGHRGRIYIMMTVAEGAFDFRVEDESGNVLWEKDQVADSEQVFLNIDEMPESVIGVLTDHTQEKDKEKLFYTVMILAATEREAAE